MKIVARELKLNDLDEFSGCDALKALLTTRSAEDTEFPAEITLDLRGCWLDYGFSHLYLDEALSLLTRSESPLRKLILEVNVDLGERHYMAALLFPQSRMLGYQADQGPAKLAQLLDDYGMQNHLSIAIHCFVSTGGVEKRSDFVFGVVI